MQYKVTAYKCKVSSVIELADNVIPIGSFYEPPDIFVICLEPIEEKKLPEETKVSEAKPGSEEE